MGFLMTGWREGRWGPVIMGWWHGMFCIGCCWALMCVLFVAGVINAIWIVVIVAYVLIKKVVPHSARTTRAVGAGLIAWGGALVFS